MLLPSKLLQYFLYYFISSLYIYASSVSPYSSFYIIFFASIGHLSVSSKNSYIFLMTETRLRACSSNAKPCRELKPCKQQDKLTKTVPIYTTIIKPKIATLKTRTFHTTYHDLDIFIRGIAAEKTMTSCIGN